METEKNPISNMLNEIRDLGHYTDSQMAAILGVHRVTVNKMRFLHHKSSLFLLQCILVLSI